MQPWEVYFEEFQRRAARVPEHQFGRGDAYAEAAHDAYQHTADRLASEPDWSDDHTMYVMRGLNAATKQWIDADGGSWPALRERLRETSVELTSGRD